MAATTSNMEDELTNEVQSPPNPQKRISGKQRKAHVLLQQHPFVGMLSLLPVLKAAQVLLVDAAQILAISMATLLRWFLLTCSTSSE